MRKQFTSRNRRRSSLSQGIGAILFGGCCYVLWPALPTVQAAAVEPQQHIPPSNIASSISKQTSVGSEQNGLMNKHDYACKGGQCNVCRFRDSLAVGRSLPLADGSSEQERVNGTTISHAELQANGIKYLQARLAIPGPSPCPRYEQGHCKLVMNGQVGGDWWNKCGDGSFRHLSSRPAS